MHRYAVTNGLHRTIITTRKGAARLHRLAQLPRAASSSSTTRRLSEIDSQHRRQLFGTIAIREIAHEDARSQRLMQLRGIGPTTASGLLARLGAEHEFRNGRQVAAWLRLTPGQHSNGGKARLGSITKAGEANLRSLLVLGTRAVIANLGEKQDRISNACSSFRAERLIQGGRKNDARRTQRLH